MENQITPPAARRIPWGILGLAVILLGYGAFLLSRFSPAIDEPDANGYWAQGSLMVLTGHTSFKPQSDAQYIGMHWLLTPSGNFVSRYPPGLPALIGVVYATFGYKASVLVNPALALAAIVGMYLAARKLFPTGWALMAAALLACNPIFTEHALQNFAHMASACCAIWGVYLLLCWSDQGKTWQIFLAGLIFGCIPTIRYPDVVMGLAVLAFMLMQWRRPKIVRDLSIGAAGAALPILPVLIRNQLLLGAFWRTGYSLTNEQTGFGWNYFRQHWASYIYSLNGDAMGLLFGLGIVGILLMLCTSKSRPLGVLLGLMILPITLVYMAYYWSMESFGTMRFLVPTVPCFVLAGVWLIQQLVISAPAPARVVVPLSVFLIQFGWASQMLAQTGRQEYSKQVLTTVTDALEETTHHGDVIVADNQVLQHLDFVREWKLADPSLVGAGFGGRGGPGGPGGGGMGGPGFGPGGGRGPRGGFGPMGGGPMGRGPGGRGGPMSDDPEAPSPMQMEKNRTLRELYQGADAQQRFAQDVRTWAGDQKIYLVGGEQEIRQTASSISPSSTVQIVKRVELLKQPELAEAGGMGPGGGPMGGRRGGRGGPMAGGPGGFGPRGGRGPMGGPGGPGGGPMGNAFAGQTEVVIARWTIPPAN